MPVEYAQGDIFQVGPEEGYQFLLVFGHIGPKQRNGQISHISRQTENAEPAESRHSLGFYGFYLICAGLLR
jgi:hypothetical protein